MRKRPVAALEGEENETKNEKKTTSLLPPPRPELGLVQLVGAVAGLQAARDAVLVLGAALRVRVAARARKRARGAHRGRRRRRCRRFALFAVRAAARHGVDAVAGADITRRVGDEPSEREKGRERKQEKREG